MNEKRTYILEELNGLYLVGTYVVDKLKKCHPHQQLYFDHISDFNQEVISTLEVFLADDSNVNLSDRLNNFLDS